MPKKKPSCNVKLLMLDIPEIQNNLSLDSQHLQCYVEHISEQWYFGYVLLLTHGNVKIHDLQEDRTLC